MTYGPSSNQKKTMQNWLFTCNYLSSIQLYSHYKMHLILHMDYRDNNDYDQTNPVDNHLSSFETFPSGLCSNGMKHLRG